jgi:hypothetical protein
MRPATKLIAAAVAVTVVATAAESALAHGTERGFVLLLPTGYYLFGGAAAVAASFLLLALVPPGRIERLTRARLRLATLPPISPVPTSLAAFGLLALLVIAGLFGSRDPLANPLPLAVWTVWWIGIALIHALLGNLWAFLNPWIGPYRIVRLLAGGRLSRAPPLAYPSRLGYWPALLFFAGFAWLELVHPAPDDPAILAVAVALYWLAAFAGMLLFGYDAWATGAEPFSIFFRLIGGLSPFIVEHVPEASKKLFSPQLGNIRVAGRGNATPLSLSLAVPGAALIAREPLPASGVLFVIMTLSSVSFDGLSRTFWWLALGDINPLEFPGRSAVIARNSAGLFAAFAVLGACYAAVVALGWVLAGRTGRLRPALGAFVTSIVPISIGFHFSHYLTALLVDGQYAMIAASDPFGTGLDLLGLNERRVTTSFLNIYESVRAIWNLQTAGIVVGHVAAVMLAHALALRHFGAGRRAALSQLPLAAFMVLYTIFGLWLLSTPVVG